jgi:hypothetical protein
MTVTGSGRCGASSSRDTNTASSALRQAIVTRIEPRRSAIGIVTRARITSVELLFAADLLVSRFFALPSSSFRSFESQEFLEKFFLRPSL